MSNSSKVSGQQSFMDSFWVALMAGLKAVIFVQHCFASSVHKNNFGRKKYCIYNMIAIFPGVEDVRHHPWHCVVASQLSVILDDRKIHLKLLFATSPRINRRTK